MSVYLQDCKPCRYSCLTCSGKSDVCVTCDPDTLRTLNKATNKCDCPEFYVDKNEVPVCVECNYSCLRCVTDELTCTECK